VRSFDGLLLADGYENATPARVAQAAQVGRSTFYEHFSGRDDLLGKRLRTILLPLAEAMSSPGVPPGLEGALEHFWSNRLTTRALLTGRGRVVVLRALTALIEERLSIASGKAKSALPPALVAAQIAGGQLAMLEAWLSGRRHCGAAALASGLHAVSIAAAQAMASLAKSDQV
jgi:AcrR family transcriptional regulator